jgi:hypothetical protein
MSKKRRKGWRASVQRQSNNADAGRRAQPPRPHRLRGMARREWIDARAMEMYQRECAINIDMFVETCELTSGLYAQQVKAARERTEAWGPDVSPYENRMSGSLAARLLREKRTWLRDCRQRIEQALEDEATYEEEQEQAGEETGAQPARHSDGDGVSASDGSTAETWSQAGHEPTPEPQPEEATLAAAATETS